MPEMVLLSCFWLGPGGGFLPLLPLSLPAATGASFPHASGSGLAELGQGDDGQRHRLALGPRQGIVTTAMPLMALSVWREVNSVS